MFGGRGEEGVWCCRGGGGELGGYEGESCGAFRWGGISVDVGEGFVDWVCERHFGWVWSW